MAFQNLHDKLIFSLASFFCLFFFVWTINYSGLLPRFMVSEFATLRPVLLGNTFGSKQFFWNNNTILMAFPGGVSNKEPASEGDVRNVG